LRYQRGLHAPQPVKGHARSKMMGIMFQYTQEQQPQWCRKDDSRRAAQTTQSWLAKLGVVDRLSLDDRFCCAEVMHSEGRQPGH